MTEVTTTITEGAKVTLHYKGTFSDGTTFDSSYDREEPMTVTAGRGQLIAGFDAAIAGMAAGETKEFSLSPEDAYGPRNEEATTTLDKSIFPDDFEFTEGMQIPLNGPNNQPFLSTLLEIDTDTITVDLNHPMAGKTLNFAVEIVSIDD